MTETYLRHTQDEICLVFTRDLRISKSNLSVKIVGIYFLPLVTYDVTQTFIKKRL